MKHFSLRFPVLRTCLIAFGFLLACLVALPGVARAQAQADTQSSPPLTLTAIAPDTLFAIQAAPGLIQIGDPVRLELRSVGDKISPDRIEEVAFAAPPAPEKWMADGAWRREYQKQKDGQPGLWHLVMRPFDIGELEIPALTVTYRDAADKRQTAQVPAGRLTVQSIRPPKQGGSTQDELIGLRGPAAIPADYSWLWQIPAILVALLVGVGLIMYWWNRRNDAARVPAEPQLPPGLWALRELDQRSQLPICQTGPAKAIFTQVSEVIRLYVGRRYGVAAIEMTTLETLQALQPLQLEDEVLRWLQQFLEECDLVKFTRQEPPRGRWVAIWDDARLIVKLTTSNEELGGAAPGAPREAQEGRAA